MNLILPHAKNGLDETHVDESRFKLPPNPKGDRVHDIDVPIPEGLPEPHLWKLLAFPVGQRRVSAGGIFLPDETLDVNNWTHQLFKIAAVGKQVMRGPAFAGYEISDDEVPKVGELWIIDPKVPRRFTFDNYTVVIVADDQLHCRVDPATVKRFKFSDGISL